ncbi:Protein of unknown function [Tistlia consotensis]|uniref:DUF1638 domain-containing protein n=1 Tax=Tistlia consotensis USBA 355 TaxID=560819 RepID=A0A1Y6BSL6_9PROT|nr:DUF1638 domain-containing protein [Tistlia consotensis]SMF17719.1 Protein of unknown function [Tistlia consotensis USBA 355]SNR40221.1 Protein of unknown function [Tistlia consotensis]
MADSASAIPRTRVIACGALAREVVEALRALPPGTPLDVTCLPAIWHNTPQKIPEGVRAKIRAARAEGIERVLVAYGDCGTGGLLDQVLAEEGASRIEGPHCYAFYSGNARFAAWAEADPACFYLTDYLARHFERLIWQGLGLDRFPQLLGDYFGNYTTLVYLSQLDDPALEATARTAAGRLKLAYRHERVGLGELGGFLAAAAAPDE